MTERELFIQNLTAISGIMRAIEEKENEVERTAKKCDEISSVLAALGIMCIGFVLGILAGYALHPLMFWVVCPATIAIYFILRSIKLGNAKKQHQQAAAQLEALKNEPAILWLPYNYRTSFAYAYLVSYVTDMRANNLQEAINLFETEMHQFRLELAAAGRA